ncbi:MAG: IS256 family transposase [Bdellovibrionaceae bacterium]|nr:IS256 family transposase [Pseudobdellovibrionaceae bacterium]
MTLSMSLIKVEISVPEIVKAIDKFKRNKIKAFEELTNEVSKSVSDSLNKLLNAEMEFFLGQPEQKSNKRNGYYEREFVLKGIGQLRLRVPKDRHSKFKSVIVPENERLDSRLKQDLAALHLSGISNRTLSLISKRILGVQVSPQTVHNSLATLEPKALEWLERPLDEDYWALFIDGTNFKVQRRGSTEKEPTLVVLGINNRNSFSILAMEPGQKDSADSWEAVFTSLIQRGLNTNKVQIGVMDGLPGLEKKFKEYFTKAVTARCWVHAKKNALQKVSKKLSLAFDEQLSQVMYANSESSARVAFNNLKQHLNKDADRAVKCIEKDLESLLVHYRFEEKFWRTLKTTNPIERINKELKRRTKSMEGLGQSTLNVLLAFTAMRLEYNWRTTPVDSPKLNNLKGRREQKQVLNKVEDTLENLIH